MATNVFETAALDISIKFENDINDVDFTVLNSDSSAYDFSNKTDSDFNVYDRNSGELKFNLGESATNGLSYASNVITLNAPWSSINLSLGNYYYEIVYEDSGTPNPTVKIIDGVLSVE